MPAHDILSPFSFRNGVRATNRVALAPMTNGQSHADGSVGDDELRWLLRRADGGFGVIETCAAHVAADGQGWEGELGIHDVFQLLDLSRKTGLLRVTSELREDEGVVMFDRGGVVHARAATR